MKKKRANEGLELIHPDRISPNPENPRLIFRQDEMESLMGSISKRGVLVPISVYKEGNGYLLIDGERRWRCAKKLNIEAIPALVQNKPSELENLILMYNIHALREQWDYFTIATKLQRVIQLYTKERGHEPNEIELSAETGLTRGQIRRCHLLLDLPDRFKNMLFEELKLPKGQQKLSEDFFIEMERSLKTVIKRFPKYEDEVDEVRDVLVNKFKNGVINAVTDFRQLSKIATAIDNLGLKKQKAEKALDVVFNSKSPKGIRDVYQTTVEFEYDERKATQQVETLTEYFDGILAQAKKEDLSLEFRHQLQELYKRLKALLKG